MIAYGWDTETYLTQPGLDSPRLVCSTWADEHQEWIANADDSVVFFQKTLESGGHLGGVNIAFDVVVMAAYQPRLLPLIFEAGNAGLFHCCSVREALNDIAKGELAEKGEEIQRYSMAMLMQRHFNKDISAEKKGDVWRYKYAQLDGVPIKDWPEAARTYALADARRSFDLLRAQRLAKFRNMQDEPAQVRAAIAIQLMCTWGLRTDADYLDYLEEKVDRAWEDVRKEFSKVNAPVKDKKGKVEVAAVFARKPDGEWKKNTKVLQALVSKAYNGKPPSTKKGAICTDRETLAESDDPKLARLGEVGKLDKLKGTYIPMLKKGVHRPVTPRFNVLVATGRVSSDWQQMPQKGGIREGVISRPGTVISSLDYGGLELRTMAERAYLRFGFSRMAEYLNTNKDAHCHFGSYIVDVSYEDFEKEKKGKYKGVRDVSKIGNFGFGGGAGAGAIVYNAKVKDNVRPCLLLKRAEKCGVVKETIVFLGKPKKVCCVCVKVVKELKEKWLKAWPEQGLLFKEASMLTAKGKTAEAVVFGSNRVRGKCRYSQWLNTPFQGAGGDGCKRAMWLIAEESYTNRRSPLWGSRIILNVHDELLIEHPEDRRHEAAFRAAKIMVDAMDQITPHAKNEVKPALMRRVFKAAEDVYDSKGKLRCWWPLDSGAPWTWGPDQNQMLEDLAA